MPKWEVHWIEQYNCRAIVEADKPNEAIKKARNLDADGESYETEFEGIRDGSWYVEGVMDDDDDV